MMRDERLNELMTDERLDELMTKERRGERSGENNESQQHSIRMSLIGVIAYMLRRIQSI